MKNATKIKGFTIRQANVDDAPVVLSLIKGLAEYEKLSHEVVATEQVLRDSLFGLRPVAEVILGDFEGEPVSFALFFHNYSTFLGRPGIYLEDLFVKPDMRRKGFGRIMLAYVANLAKERQCGRIEWSVLDWNDPAWKFYKSIGASPMDEWTVHRVTGDGISRLAAEF